MKTLAQQKKLVKALEQGYAAAKLARGYIYGSFPNTVEGNTAEERGLLVWGNTVALFGDNLEYERAQLEKMVRTKDA